MHPPSTFKPPSDGTIPAASRRARAILGALGWAIILPIPIALALTGAWIGSTLAIHHDGPVWLALVGAVVVFAVLPYLWDVADDPKQTRGRVRDAIFRSSFLSLVLIGIVLGTHAKTTYAALATRGDWFLAGAQTPAAKGIRSFMFDLAERFLWLDELARSVSYQWADTSNEAEPTGSTVAAGSLVRVNSDATGTATQTAGSAPSKPDEPASVTPPGYQIAGTDHVWPLDPAPHPLVTSMPAEVQTSYRAVGAWLKANEPDEFMRAKAVHDFVALWVRYDHKGLLADTAFSNNNQSAARVFTRRLGVCAGYANLAAALANAAGLKAVVVTGPIRWSSDYNLTSATELEQGKRRLARGDTREHAWNAVMVDRRWHLMDVTWDAPNWPGATLDSTYLFIPPEVMLADHLATNRKWQLLEKTMTRGDWLRSQNLGPHAFLFNIRFLNVSRPIVPYAEPLRIEVSNPYHGRISAYREKAAYLSIDEASTTAVEGAASKASPGEPCGKPSRADPAVFVCAGGTERTDVNLYVTIPGETRRWARAASLSMEAP